MIPIWHNRRNIASIFLLTVVKSGLKDLIFFLTYVSEPFFGFDKRAKHLLFVFSVLWL